jgi:heterotetrameric sarcosine oxidase gamma subunit
MVDEEALIARAPFMNMDAASDGGQGVIVVNRDGLGLATVIVKRGQLEALAQRIRERYGIELPLGNVRREAHGVGFAGLGPETWLATSEKGGNEFSTSLREEIGALASISDQSDGYAVLRLVGGKVRDTLAKLVPLDVHPRAFKQGDVASTVASHIGITLWRLDDAANGRPAFEIAVFRSLAGSFGHALAQSAAEFGFIIAR